MNPSMQERATDEIELREEILQLLLKKDRASATEKITNYLEKEAKFYATRFDEKNEMYYYSAYHGIYLPEGKSFIKENIRALLGQAYTEQLANMVISKIEADNYIEQKELFKRHYKNEVACENGILNLETKKLEPFTPTKIFLTKIPIKFCPEADCPEIKKFLSEVLPSEDDVKTIEEVFGYCLQGDYPIQKIILFIGDGSNGKGQTLELLRSFLGEGNYASIPLQQLQNSDFKEIELFNKMANIGADISDAPLKETSKIKGLSGGDAHNASVKFKHDVTFVNEAKLIFSANKLPKTYDLSFAFFRRWVYLTFPFAFVGPEDQGSLSEEKLKFAKIKKTEIIKRIITPTELSGLLNLALVGLERIHKKGNFTTSRSNEETRKWWVRNSDSFLAFCWEEIEECYDGWIGKDELRKHYQKYCRNNKIMAENDNHIYQIMVREMHVWEDQDRETGGRVWNGVKWISSPM